MKLPEITIPTGSEAVERGSILQVELEGAGGNRLEWRATPLLLQALSLPWASTKAALEVVLGVAARQGGPLPQIETVPPKLDDPNPGQPSALARTPGTLLDGAESVRVVDRVAILRVEGKIIPRASYFSSLSGLASLEDLNLDLAAAAESSLVDAIVLQVDGPGGVITNVSQFAQHVRDVRERKPVVTFSPNQMASAHFWIGAAADWIVIDKTADVGSVGVIMTVIRSESNNKIVQFVSSTAPDKRTDAGTETGRMLLQAHVDTLGGIFVETIADYRGISIEQVTSARGGVRIGKEAVASGFADQLGTLATAIAKAKQLADERRRAASFPSVQPTMENQAMKISETALGQKILALLSSEAEATAATPVAPAVASAPAIAPVAPTVPAVPVAPAMSTATVAPAIAAGHLETLKLLAAAEVDKMVLGSKLLPNAQEAAKAELLRAMQDDILLPVASGEPSRADLFKARYDQAKAHALFGETVKPQGKLFAVPQAIASKDEDLEAWKKEEAAAIKPDRQVA